MKVGQKRTRKKAIPETSPLKAEPSLTPRVHGYPFFIIKVHFFDFKVIKSLFLIFTPFHK